jgi:hypothetical protein
MLIITVTIHVRAIAEAVSSWLPIAGSGQVGFVVDKVTSGQVFSIHSTKFSIRTITRGRYNRPVSGRRAEWTQFGLCKFFLTIHAFIVELHSNVYEITNRPTRRKKNRKRTDGIPPRSNKKTYIYNKNKNCLYYIRICFQQQQNN